MYSYYVVYQHRMGYGCIEMTRERKVKTYDDVIGMAEAIENLGKAKGVVVTHYSEMKRVSDDMKRKLSKDKNWFQRLVVSLFF